VFRKIRNKVLAIIVAMAVMLLPIFSGTMLAKATPVEQPIYTDVTDNVKAELIRSSIRVV